MNCREISIAEIDLTNEIFRISEDAAGASLQASLSEIGQLNPVLLTGCRPPYAIVCGFRRLNALRRLGASRAVARIIEGKSRDPLGAFDLALWDNLSHRQLDLLERARVLYKLANVFGVSEDAIVRDYLPRLDLRPHGRILRNYIMLHGAHPGLRNQYRQGRLAVSSMECLAAMPRPSQEFLASVLEEIRLSAGLQRKFFSLLEELAAMRDAESHAPLEDPAVRAVLNDAALSGFQRGEKLYAHLYRCRYPGVTEAREKFLERKKSLGLPGSIRIVPAPYFETPDLRVEFSAADPERFREAAAALSEASRKPGLDGLFKVN